MNHNARKFFANVHFMSYQKRLYLKPLRSYEEKPYHGHPVHAIELGDDTKKIKKKIVVFFLGLC